MNGGSVYWTDLNDSNVRKVVPGSLPVTLETGQPYPAPLVADDTGLYYGVWGFSAPAGATIRRRAPGGGLTDLYPGVEPSYAMALDATYLYFATADGHIYRGTRSGGSLLSLAAGQGDIWGLAVADGYAFYTSIHDGFVARVPIDGSAQPTILATGQCFPEGIAVDANWVYWVNQASGEVMRLAR